MDFRAILTTFARHDLKFIVVGGVAAGMQGAFYATLDDDLVHAPDADKVRRVIAALEELDAHYRAVLPRLRRALENRRRSRQAAPLFSHLRLR